MAQAHVVAIRCTVLKLKLKKETGNKSASKRLVVGERGSRAEPRRNENEGLVISRYALISCSRVTIKYVKVAKLP